MFTYCLPNDGAAAPSTADSASLASFQAKLLALGHYQTVQPDHQGLQLHFEHQLEALTAEQFNLETAVRRARVGGNSARWQGRART